MTLAELKMKYIIPNATHEPKADCKFCKGVGERFVKKLDKMTFCICLFVDHDLSDMAGDELGKIARRELEKLKGG